MIHEIRPRQHLRHQRTVPTIPRRDTLHIRRKPTLSIQRLALFHLIDHLAHVHLDLAVILRPAVEAQAAALPDQERRGEEAHAAREAEDGPEGALAGEGGGVALGRQHEGGADDTDGPAVDVVGLAGVGEGAAPVAVGGRGGLAWGRGGGGGEERDVRVCVDDLTDVSGGRVLGTELAHWVVGVDPLRWYKHFVVPHLGQWRP